MYFVTFGHIHSVTVDFNYALLEFFVIEAFSKELHIWVIVCFYACKQVVNLTFALTLAHKAAYRYLKQFPQV